MNNECERLVLCCAAPLLNYGSSIQQLSPSQFAPPLAIFHRLHLQSLKINEELQRGNERMCVCVREEGVLDAARTEVRKKIKQTPFHKRHEAIVASVMSSCNCFPRVLGNSFYWF